MSADPLDEIDLLISQIADLFRDYRFDSWRKIKALIQTYGEQCAFNAIHPKCTCSKCTGRPDYEDIQDDIDEFMKEGDPS